MDDKTMATMNEEEFDAMVDRFIERGEDQVTPRTFLQVMTDVAEQRSQQETFTRVGGTAGGSGRCRPEDIPADGRRECR